MFINTLALIIHAIQHRTYISMPTPVVRCRILPQSSSSFTCRFPNFPMRNGNGESIMQDFEYSLTWKGRKQIMIARPGGSSQRRSCILHQQHLGLQHWSVYLSLKQFPGLQNFSFRLRRPRLIAPPTITVEPDVSTGRTERRMYALQDGNPRRHKIS